MKISIFGLGYVGAVSAACLAKEGHAVIGVDPNATKISLINQGKTPIIEKDLEDLMTAAVEKDLLRATSDVADAIASSSVSLICVGTPSQLNGSLDLKYVRNVCEEIGEALTKKTTYHVVVVRSTMLPGTMENVVIPTLEAASGKKIGVDFGVCINPEFLRESTAVYDYFNPPKTVIGETDVKSGDIMVELFGHFDAPLIRVDVSTAEMVKYTDNVWHAVKVSFANEIGNICKGVNIDSHTVMNIFCQDTKLNISPYYMKPGFAFGGSCLPKDVRALQYKAKSLDLDLPLIGSLLDTNNNQIAHGYDLVTKQGNRKISILGFSFKAGTDDLRESPIVELIEKLIGKGYDLKLYDNSVNIAKLTGANKDYILNAIPHISNLMVDSMEEAVTHGETIVIGNKSAEFKDILDKITEKQVVVDLVRIVDSKSEEGKYDGICW
ncbi:UDP-glucose/GDP-mannose dehydrogenase family protein [uncultured Paraglaciecola sp.]|uniref:nucleotide sugar dehydrogenase n=1 Tax=uncultured Paraglaciecola sp. TaxID=1765024 RepID=UPI00259AC9CC|nr:UDP-glucose/GDP-mannose dehydrogenase family protein [uncultured Paraglaciecola sp.]